MASHGVAARHNKSNSLRTTPYGVGATVIHSLHPEPWAPALPAGNVGALAPKKDKNI